MTRILVNGVHLNVLTAGEGKPLVLLHGFTGRASTWEPFFSAFSAVRRVVAIDLLGHGSSDSPPDSERYRIERCIDDLTVLFTKLQIDEYDLLGYSLGGRVALHLALAHEARVGGLILESTSPGIHGPVERAARVREDEARAEMLEREGLVRFVDYWESLPLFASHRALDGETRARLRRQRLESSAQGLAGSLRGFGAGVPEPLLRRLGELRAPLIVAGELDEKYCRLAKIMGRLMPGARVEIVSGVGHTVHLERPEVFERLVLGYLDKGVEEQDARTLMPVHEA